MLTHYIYQKKILKQPSWAYVWGHGFEPWVLFFCFFQLEKKQAPVPAKTQQFQNQEKWVVQINSIGGGGIKFLPPFFEGVPWAKRTTPWSRTHDPTAALRCWETLLTNCETKSVTLFIYGTDIGDPLLQYSTGTLNPVPSLFTNPVPRHFASINNSSPT